MLIHEEAAGHALQSHFLPEMFVKVRAHLTDIHFPGLPDTVFPVPGGLHEQGQEGA